VYCILNTDSRLCSLKSVFCLFCRTSYLKYLAKSVNSEAGNKENEREVCFQQKGRAKAVNVLLLRVLAVALRAMESF